ncbi:MAG: hypothetical protein ACRD3Q_15495 [Terriglobales bacterium]
MASLPGSGHRSYGNGGRCPAPPGAPLGRRLRHILSTGKLPAKLTSCRQSSGHGTKPNRNRACNQFNSHLTGFGLDHGSTSGSPPLSYAIAK